MTVASSPVGDPRLVFPDRPDTMSPANAGKRLVGAQGHSFETDDLAPVRL